MQLHKADCVYIGCLLVYLVLYVVVHEGGREAGTEGGTEGGRGREWARVRRLTNDDTMCLQCLRSSRGE